MKQHVGNDNWALDVVLNALLISDKGTLELTDIAKVSRSWIAAVINKLLTDEKIHILRWEDIPPKNSFQRAIYRHGLGLNAPFIARVAKKRKVAIKVKVKTEIKDCVIIKPTVKRCMYVAAIFGNKQAKGYE